MYRITDLREQWLICKAHSLCLQQFVCRPYNMNRICVSHSTGISIEVIIWNRTHGFMDKSELKAENTIQRKVTIKAMIPLQNILMDVFGAMLICQVQWKRQRYNLDTRRLSTREHVKQQQNTIILENLGKKKKKN